MNTEITVLRNKIDDIDNAILNLLVQRMNLASEIGEIKNRYGLPVYAPKREAEMLAARRKKAEKLGISPDLFEDLLLRIIRESYISENKKSL